MKKVFAFALFIALPSATAFAQVSSPPAGASPAATPTPRQVSSRPTNDPGLLVPPVVESGSKPNQNDKAQERLQREREKAEKDREKAQRREKP